MGSDLPARTGKTAPRFAVSALADPGTDATPGAELDRPLQNTRLTAVPCRAEPDARNQLIRGAERRVFHLARTPISSRRRLVQRGRCADEHIGVRVGQCRSGRMTTGPDCSGDPPFSLDRRFHGKKDKEDEKTAGLARNTCLGLQAPTPTGSRDQTKEAGLIIFPGAYRSNKVGYRWIGQWARSSG